MRSPLLALFSLATLACVSAPSAQATPYPRLFVGSTDGKIRTFDLTKAGELRPRSTSRGPKGLRFLAFHPRLDVIYGAVGKSVQVYRREGRAWQAGSVRKTDVGGTHIEVDPRGRFVFLASYGGGAIQAWPLDANGEPGKRAFDLRAPAELCRKAHQVRAHPGGSFVYAPCLGDDVVQILAIDGSDIAHVGRTRLATGCGPRHMDFAPGGRFAYVINERTSSIYAYRVAPRSGALVELQVVNALPEGRTEFSRSSDIHVSASGRFVYAVHREPLDEIVACRRGEDGKLTVVGRTRTGGGHSRSFALTRDGRYVVLAHSKSKNVIVRRIDEKSGLVGVQSAKQGTEEAAIFAGFAPR